MTLNAWHLALSLACLFPLVLPQAGAQQPGAIREFPPGRLTRLDELPASRLRTQLQRLPLTAQRRGLEWLRSFHFTELDLNALHADRKGGIFYVCDGDGSLPARLHPQPQPAPAESDSPVVAAAAVPVNPLPAGLIFHSRPGAPNILYLDFNGENVVNTEWNDELNRSSIPAVAFSTDSDFTTFSDAEQLTIKRIWQRVSEDYAPFNIDVTTERPAAFNNSTAHALITRSTDSNGETNLFSTGGGIAYVNVFGQSAYARHRPAWIYYNNLANDESYIAEAVSHEIGHNLSLNHDGQIGGPAYYAGHGSGGTSWGPVMGLGYGRNVSQWSRGEYYQANNTTQDDLAAIDARISYRTDDHGGTPGTATLIVLSGGTNIISTTPENDPANANPANKGVIARNTDTDVFSFGTGSGTVSLSVNPWISPSGSRGGNLDLLLELRNESGALLLTSNPADQTTAQIQTTLPEGRYFLHVRNSAAGDPLSSTPTGYTSYGSIGQYFITGYVVSSNAAVNPPVAALQVTDITQSGQGPKQFTVTYSDDVAVNVSTIDSSDIRVTGPNGYNTAASFVSVNPANNGTPRVATYAASPPSGGTWSPADNGTYSISVQPNQVGDTEGASVVGGTLGQFIVAVPLPGELAVIPAGSFRSSGTVGGPFSPSSTTYTLTNIGATSLDWTLGKTADWLTLSATSGTLPASGTINVTVSVNAAANALVASAYSDVIGFTNITTGAGDTTRAVALTVNSPGVLELLPATGLTASGTLGGPFSPSTTTYILTNSGGSSLNWTATKAQNWIGLSSASGTLAVGAATTITVSFNSAADGLSSGSYSDTITFANASTGLGNTTRPVSLTVNTPGQLEISPARGLTASGIVGGPFNPSTTTYILTNSGGSSLNWTAAKAQNWTSLSTASGTLDPGGTTTVTVSINSAADSLTPGNYSDTISFVNTSAGNGNTTRSVSLTVNTPGQLEILPAGGLIASGTAGGPFTPPAITYTLTNSGGSSLDWTATKAQNWLSLSSSSGTLSPGATTTVIASLNSAADSLSSGSYSDTITFVNSSTGIGNAPRPVSLTVTSPGQLEILPTRGFTASGTIGGPFTPSTTAYTLTNSGGSPLNWTATKAQNWVSLSSVSGALAPGATTAVTVSLNSDADILSSGSYSDTISFVNSSTGVGNATRPVSLAVTSPGQLEILPGGGFTASGIAGGPFTPSTITYTLTNSGGSTLNWTASETQTWISLSETSGTLPAGAFTSVTVSINGDAQRLAPGNYTDAVMFTNITTGVGNATRNISLTVNPTPGQLTVSPADNLLLAGTAGGPFTPAAFTYQLSNTGGSNLNWTVSANARWLAFSASAGSLAPGATTNITVSLDGTASTLSPGTYSDTILFANSTTSAGNTTRAVTLTVNAPPGRLVVNPSQDFASAGTVGGPFTPSTVTYTLTNSGGSSLDWTATNSAAWLTLSATAGTLASGSTTNIVVSINSSADGLRAGNYSDTIGFTNVTTGAGNTTRALSLTVNPQPMVELTVTINDPARGIVAPTNGSYTIGSSIEVVATPAAYYRFAEWTGDATGTTNPLHLVLNTNLSVMAMFSELLTTNFPTPHWWLATHGYTNDFENAVRNLGANGLPRWQSYIAGLNPNDPESQLRLTSQRSPDGSAYVLNWNTTTNRLYTVLSGTNLLIPSVTSTSPMAATPVAFAPLPGATNLPWTTHSFTNTIDPSSPQRFYRIEVHNP